MLHEVGSETKHFRENYRIRSLSERSKMVYYSKKGMNYGNRKLSLWLNNHFLPMQKTIQLIPVHNEREDLKLRIPAPDLLIKNNSVQRKWLLPDEASLIKNSFPLFIQRASGHLSKM